AAAHLIHGSSDGRFNITYCTQHLSREEIEGVGYKYLSYQDALELYPIAQLKSGYNTLDSGKEVYYIPNPALGLWIEKGRLE
ncbi:MAG: D-mannonate epimerase, partial [Clostridiales bacterium]|nr:D-mannonate epimerase [Clostridiales bacterium]